jgi:hypothetical protein
LDVHRQGAFLLVREADFSGGGSAAYNKALTRNDWYSSSFRTDEISIVV